MSGVDAPGRWAWPELVGVSASLAVPKIKQDRPDVGVQVIPDGTPVPPDFNAERVRVFYDSLQPGAIVTQIPKVG
ncbi:hypothetical protein BRADI_3g02393v3 [Brachypodium distachyon]|uniref:Subtilisin inhibitor 1 n=1 Tax=Brachypodium distachyon TaxID=15368 RepID=A0A0Q3J3W0_BRADI|nr:hypothetical protein BRADI_3g02393v3 [Brachypodium distachyon]